MWGLRIGKIGKDYGSIEATRGWKDHGVDNYLDLEKGTALHTWIRTYQTLFTAPKQAVVYAEQRRTEVHIDIP